MNGEFKFAVVKSANADGVVVQFEDDQTPSPKKYTRLQSCNCIAGERVLMAPISGSFVALCMLCYVRKVRRGGCYDNSASR